MTRTWLAAIAAWRREWFRPRTLGERGEAVAAKYLKRLGYKIVARGERGRLGHPCEAVIACMPFSPEIRRGCVR
jgi:hypothetical protein